MNFFHLIRLLIELMPVLIDAIKAAEDALPGEGKGEAKLVMVRGVLEAAYEAATDTQADFTQIWPAVKRTIDSVVSAFNAVGLFRKQS